MGYRPVKSGGEFFLQVEKRGQDVIHNPLLNKGAAFPPEERKALSLEGLLPPHVADLEEQLVRSKENFDHKEDDIEKYIYLRALQDRNETLFYALLHRHIHEMLPIIYTPTVGDAVEKYGHIYRNARGLFITPSNVDQMDCMADNLPSRDIDIIVVTDSQGILGIGDQGVGGMAIPIGKLSLYTVGAGIHPSGCLPICLDVGTDNEELLADPLYLGRKHKRLRGREYDDFIRKFVDGIKRNFPDAILQWEDFSKQNAFTNLDRYRAELPSFNDDIQGTGAVTLGGIITALRIKNESLSAQRYAILGAGAAGIGIARQIHDALLQDGMEDQAARDAIFVLDSKGLVIDDRENLDEYKSFFSTRREILSDWKTENDAYISLGEVVRDGKVTVLIGVSAWTGAFDESLLSLMLDNTPEPVILPLSNPTSKAEGDPRHILEYTKGKALVASGSPFDPVEVGGEHFEIGQGNNAFIFPGVGLGILLSRTRNITPSLFTAAAHALASSVEPERLRMRSLYPPVEDLFKVSRRVAKAVYEKALQEGVGRAVEGDVEAIIHEQMWVPSYAKYRAVQP